MNNLAVTDNRILSTPAAGIENVRKLEDMFRDAEQVKINTNHILHGGMYSRTIKIPSGTVLAGAMIKIGTILISQGEVLVYIGDKTIKLDGYNVFAASANRKQAYFAISDVYLTTVFPTRAKTIEDAEEEFTDEANLLLSRIQQDTNTAVITGE